jgi:hypothetical protein
MWHERYFKPVVYDCYSADTLINVAMGIAKFLQTAVLNPFETFKFSVSTDTVRLCEI